ncbi:MAG: EFR1 family ferrodoxin [Candidatus Hermodarchaeota archaeon]
MSHIIYYFSGTGNSYSIAKELSQSLKNCELIPIARIWQEPKIEVTSNIIGFVFPLYYWGLPRIVKEFVIKLNMKESNYIYSVITRAGNVNGIPLMQLEQILVQKNTHLNAGFFIQMPNNYILGYSADSESENQIIIDQAKTEVNKILDFVRNQKSNLITSELARLDSHTEKLNADFHQSVLESDKKFYVDEKCTGCGICEQVCPVKNIEIIGSKPKWIHQCQQCLACINYCPEEAIQFGRKTLKSGRYHHPDISYKELSNQYRN